jgi:hypothetical protein
MTYSELAYLCRSIISQTLAGHAVKKHDFSGKKEMIEIDHERRFSSFRGGERDPKKFIFFR